MATLNLENPIFVIHLNIDGKPRQRAEEEIAKLVESYRYNNATFWFLPQTEGKNKIELIWKGSNYSNILNPEEEESYKKSVIHLHTRLNKILELIADGVSDSTLKQKLREFSLNELLP